MKEQTLAAASRTERPLPRTLRTATGDGEGLDKDRREDGEEAATWKGAAASIDSMPSDVSRALGIWKMRASG